MGVHQKIDRVARRHLQVLLPEKIDFPGSKQILHFEGKNGPDGIKRKSPSIDEPWHFINPDRAHDAPLLDMIEQHINNLTKALVASNQERAAFEASWLAHAITDGLTPAHHFPLEEVLADLRGGQGLETRTSIVKKGMMTGSTPVQLLRNNWKYWGARGAMTTHLAFEVGVASVVPYQRFHDGRPDATDITKVEEEGYRGYFVRSVYQVASMKMYEEFSRAGWTTDLARQTNKVLMPLIIRAVVLGWMSAVWGAQKELE